MAANSRNDARAMQEVVEENSRNMELSTTRPAECGFIRANLQQNDFLT